MAASTPVKTPEVDVTPVTPATDSLSEATVKDESPTQASNGELTFARRGDEVDAALAAAGADGFDAERMKDRSLLTAEEEKALMRRVDWRIMTVCSLLFLIKNLDADNISNARIMNLGTGRNIMAQLNMSSDQYGLLNVLYYVCLRHIPLVSQANPTRSPISCLKLRRTYYSRSLSPALGSPGS
jgi:hypothetical protein